MTVAEIDAIIADLKTAYVAAVKASSYNINLGGTSRQLTRQKITDLRSELNYWELEKKKLQSGRLGIPMRFLTPN